jgi:septum formation protein
MSLQADHPRLILASGSESRRRLLQAAGLQFAALAAQLDEGPIKQAARQAGVSAGEAALQLARRKAETVARDHPEALVIGCDQILQCEDRWFDKAVNLRELRTQLQELVGREHRLMTATVCWAGGGLAWQHLEQPRLRMRAFGSRFIDEYLAAEGAALFGCVGGYRLEGLGIHLFAEVDGDYSAILGLPLIPLLRFLRERRILLS